jgi:hypothetical protein
MHNRVSLADDSKLPCIDDLKKRIRSTLSEILVFSSRKSHSWAESMSNDQWLKFWLQKDER